MIIRQPYSGIVPERGRTGGSARNEAFKTILENVTKSGERGGISSETVQPATGNSSLVSLGVINRSTPTVSHLLIKNGDFGRECWEIIYDKINANKPYRKIPAGTEIFIDKSTREIIWNDGKTDVKKLQNMKNLSPMPVSPHFVDEKNGLGKKIVDGVESYLGHKYDEVDCYELVVKGLEKAGIKYYGTGGLSEYLIDMAREQGKSLNRFFNGEGLVHASGTSLFSKRIKSPGDAEKTVMKLVNEMTPLLGKGDILSFSTQTRGHTGVVSQKNGIWTYINSGKIDHDIVDHNKRLKGVGEEMLSSELLNWVNLAADRKEDLEITLGRLDENKLLAFQKKNSVSGGLLF